MGFGSTSVVTSDQLPSTAAPSALKIVVVDDHTILRQGLTQLLSTAKDIVIVAEAGDGDEAIVQALTHRPDVILMDVNMGKVNGYDASRAILAAWPDARIIVLTNQDNPAVIQKFQALGVKGFLMKDVNLDALIAGIRQVAYGNHRIPLSEDLSAIVEQAEKRLVKNRLVDLTDREKEVLCALAKGHSNRQLADMLVVSPKTVHNHLYNIYSKIGVSSRAEAIVWAIESGFTGSGG